ncbi:proline-rich protein HaeIII subfamily 1-like [Schistocerca serialis cubense]|uniref:proline-rich protein HaeIII subfamily 1-like n=1 Tax=Schistocerca serialis cubense TaxID=2023355 RepID=UPI00214EA670|nr:proline-rich protein HaeIII subfamily 1-like [Schistocerca serialis cubense]
MPEMGPSVENKQESDSSGPKESQQIQSLVEAIAKQAANPPTQKEQAQAAPPFRAFDASREEWREYFAQLQAHMTVYKITDLVRGGFQPHLPTSLPPPGQQQQPSPLPRRQPVPLMPPAQLHPRVPQEVAPAPAVPLQSPPPSELMDVDPSAGPPSQAVAVQPVLQPLSLDTPKESDTAAPCPAPTQQPSTPRVGRRGCVARSEGGTWHGCDLRPLPAHQLGPPPGGGPLSATRRLVAFLTLAPSTVGGGRPHPANHCSLNVLQRRRKREMGHDPR